MKTALTPIEINFFSSTGGIIPPTMTGIFDKLFFFNNSTIVLTRCTCDPDKIDSPMIWTPSSIAATTNCSGVDLIPS